MMVLLLVVAVGQHDGAHDDGQHGAMPLQAHDGPPTGVHVCGDVVACYSTHVFNTCVHPPHTYIGMVKQHLIKVTG